MKLIKTNKNIIDYIKNKSWQKKKTTSNERLKGSTQCCLEKFFETNTKDKNALKRHDLSKPAFDFKTLFDQ